MNETGAHPHETAFRARATLLSGDDLVEEFEEAMGAPSNAEALGSLTVTAAHAIARVEHLEEQLAEVAA